MAGIANLLKGRVYDRSYTDVDLRNERNRGQIFGLYFGASWCSSSCVFTSLLSELYQEHYKEKGVKVIYIGADHDEQSFRNYYRTMPWFAFDYKDRKRREALMNKFGVDKIPKLVLVDGDTGEVICTDAAEQILDLDSEEANFSRSSG